MIRKTVILLLVFTGIIPFACCPEQPSGPYRVELNFVSPLKSGYMHPLPEPTASFHLNPDDVYEGDTLLLGLQFYSLLAYQSPAFSLHPSAMALSCPEYPDFTFLQDKISSVQVYSNQPFHEVQAGEPLTGKVSIFTYRDRQIITLQQAITNMNTLNFYEGMEMGLGSLVLPGKPAESATRTFTVRIAYESGREDIATTAPVTWQ